MKQINDYKNKNLELKENCILEKLANFLFNNNRSVNRNTQNKELSSKVFFITLIVIYLSPCFVNAYAGNDAVYTIPSQRQSKQVTQMNQEFKLQNRNYFLFITFFQLPSIFFLFQHDLALFDVQIPR